VYVCPVCAWFLRRSEEISDPLELELQMVVRFRVCLLGAGGGELQNVCVCLCVRARALVLVNLSPNSWHTLFFLFQKLGKISQITDLDKIFSCAPHPQGFCVCPRLSWNQVLYGLLSAGIKGVCHHCSYSLFLGLGILEG